MERGARETTTRRRSGTCTPRSGTHGGAGFFSTRAQVMSLGERRARIEAGHPKLSLSRQCRLLRVSRSSLYHKPKGESEGNRALMRRLDELFMAYPFNGSRQMVRHLRREGVHVGRHRVRRLMGLEAIYQAPRTGRRIGSIPICSRVSPSKGTATCSLLALRARGRCAIGAVGW